MSWGVGNRIRVSPLQLKYKPCCPALLYTYNLYRTKFLGLKTSGPRQLAVEFKSPVFQEKNIYRNEQLLRNFFDTPVGEAPDHRATQLVKTKGKAVHPTQSQEPAPSL